MVTPQDLEKHKKPYYCFMIERWPREIAMVEIGGG